GLGALHAGLDRPVRSLGLRVVGRALVRRLRPVGSGDHLIDGGAAAPARAVAVAAVEVSARAGAVQRRRGPKTRHAEGVRFARATGREDRKSTRLNSSHVKISYAVFCLKK